MCQIGTIMMADTDQQAGRPICARICARDVAGQAETGETQKAWGDFMPQVCRGQRGDQRPHETPETRVVWLITQRPMVVSGPEPSTRATPAPAGR